MSDDPTDNGQSRSEFNQLYAWISWTVAAVFLVYQISMQNALGSVQEGFEHSLGISEKSIAVISSSFFISYALMQVPAGVLIDRFGVGWVVAPACLLLGFGGWMLSSAETIPMAVAARVLMGVGEASVSSRSPRSRSVALPRGDSMSPRA